MLFNHSGEALDAALEASREQADALLALVYEAVDASRHVADLKERTAWCAGYVAAKWDGVQGIGDISDVLMAAIVVQQLPNLPKE